MTLSEVGVRWVPPFLVFSAPFYVNSYESSYGCFRVEASPPQMLFARYFVLIFLRGDG